MKPHNQQERRSTQLRFWGLYLLSLLLIIGVVYFNFLIPNQSEKVYQKKFLEEQDNSKAQEQLTEVFSILNDTLENIERHDAEYRANMEANRNIAASKNLTSIGYEKEALRNLITKYSVSELGKRSIAASALDNYSNVLAYLDEMIILRTEIENLSKDLREKSKDNKRLKDDLRKANNQLQRFSD